MQDQANLNAFPSCEHSNDCRACDVKNGPIQRFFFFIFHFWFQQKLIYISVPIHVINSKKKKKNDHPTAVDILNVLTIHPPASIVHTVWCSTKCTFIIVFSLLAVVALTTVWFPQRLKRIFVANFWLNFFVCSILDICAMEKVKKEGLMQ